LWCSLTRGLLQQLMDPVLAIFESSHHDLIMDSTTDQQWCSGFDRLESKQETAWRKSRPFQGGERIQKFTYIGIELGLAILVLVRIVTEKIGKLQVFLRAPLVLVKCKIDKSLSKNALLRRASLFCHSGDCSSSTSGWLGQVRDRVPSQICQDCSNNITMFFLPFVQVGLCHLHHPQAALGTRLKMSTEDDVGGWSTIDDLPILECAVSVDYEICVSSM